MKPPGTLDKDHLLSFQHLHRAGGHGDRGVGFPGGDCDADEQAWPPGEFGIAEYHARFGGSGVLTDQGADAETVPMATSSKELERMETFSPTRIRARSFAGTLTLCPDQGQV